MEYLDKKYSKADNRLLPDDAEQYGKVSECTAPFLLSMEAIARLVSVAATVRPKVFCLINEECQANISCG